MQDDLEIYGLQEDAQNKLALLMILVGVAPVVLAQTDLVSHFGISLETSRAAGKFLLPGAALAVTGAFLHSGGIAKGVGYLAGAYGAFFLLSVVNQ